MKTWPCVVAILLCAQTAWAQPPEDSPPYPETAPAFGDVVPAHWAFHAVEQLRLEGILNGVTQPD